MNTMRWRGFATRKPLTIGGLDEAMRELNR